MNKTYAFSDIHGMYNLWKQIKEYCDETDTIYFLGDAADRGPDGIKIINELLYDKRVKFIKGNHEDMLALCVPDLIEGYCYNMFWWFDNGGDSTWNTLERCSDDSKMWYVHKINQLPEFAWYESPLGHRVFLTHAGTDLHWTKEEREQIIKQAYLWDRKHFNFTHPVNMPDVIQVHGHTPTKNLAKVIGLPQTTDVITYCDGHKIDIDCGAFATKKVALIDLDTFEVKYFYEEQI